MTGLMYTESIDRKDVVSLICA